MLANIFWNVVAPALIVGVPLFWLASWIWAFGKVDGFVRKMIDPKPPKPPLPKNAGEALLRYLDERKNMGLPPPDEPMDVLARRYRDAMAHHH